MILYCQKLIRIHVIRPSRPESCYHEVESVDLRPFKSSRLARTAAEKTSQVVTLASISKNFALISKFLIHFLVPRFVKMTVIVMLN